MTAAISPTTFGAIFLGNISMHSKNAIWFWFQGETNEWVQNISAQQNVQKNGAQAS